MLRYAVLGGVVCLCVCVLVTSVSPAITVELIKMPFAVLPHVGAKNHALDRRTYWRHLANTTERSVLGDDH